MKIVYMIFILGWASVTHVSNAYDLATHGRLTFESYKASILHSNVLLEQLGVQNENNPFGSEYYEVFPERVVKRQWNIFEQEKNRMPRGTEPLSIPGWFMRGAIREDDHRNQNFIWPLTSCSINAPNPQYIGLTNRPLNHFFDPWLNEPFDPPFMDPGLRAPQWALGSVEPFDIPQQEEAERENHYTLFDAIEAMYRALTAHSSSGGKMIMPDDNEGAKEPSNAAEEEAVRKAYWATTFRSLGNAMHLIQDMAQPQHTRNDAHSGVCGPWAQAFLTGHSSVYEAYIEARATGDSYNIPGVDPVPAAGLTYGSYPVPQFNDYVSYFSTRHLDSSILTSRGLADYSNRGFFSAGTNLGSNRYAYPSDNSSDYTAVNYSTDWQGKPLPGGASVTLLYGNVEDSMTGTGDSAALTTNGLWDQFLTVRGEQPRYTLTKQNYDDMASLLLPRAVAYSAGFIDYFFRGRLDVVRVDEEIDPLREMLVYRIKIRNASGVGNTLRDGQLQFFYDGTDGFRKPMTILSAGSGQLDGAGLAPNAEMELIVEIPDDRDIPTDMTLVFKGKIGNEPGVAGRIFDNGPDVYVLDIETREVYQFSPTGQLRGIQTTSGNIGLSVYNDTIYSAQGGVTTMPIPNDTSVNDNEVYRSYVDYSGAWVDVSDHQGGFLRQLDVSPGWKGLGGVVRVAANNSHFATTNNEELYINTVDGLQVAKISGIDIDNQEVAITRDRVYIVNAGMLEIYTLDGQFQGLVSNTPHWWFASLGVTENHLYVVETQWNGSISPRTNELHIYDREVIRNEAGAIVSDTYEYRGAVDFSSISKQPRSTSVDRQGMWLD
ncbi:MAG: hypothetical protein ABFS39_01550 [Pseudomonadota bacterium]